MSCCCNATGKKAWAVVSALVAIGCFSVAIFLPPSIDAMLKKGLEDATVLDANAKAENSKAYRTFTDPSDPDANPVYFSAYLFTVTNSPQIVLSGAIPNVQERGPYVYRKRTYKRNVEFTKNVYQQDLMSYQTQTQYEFVPERSTGSESDLITNVNLPFAATRGPTQGQLYGAYPSDQFRFFTTRNVSSWLFGYADPVIDTLHRLYPLYVSRFQGVLGPNENALNPRQPFDTIYVGTKPDQQLVKQYVKYNGMDSLLTPTFTPPSTVTYSPQWKTGSANRVYGSDGSQFPRGLEDGQTIAVYVSQLTRVLTLANINNEHVTFKGVDLLHFTVPTIFLGNAAMFPANADFYMFGYYGMANLTATGRPDFYVSKPHFLDADPALVGNCTGLNPNRALHDTFLNVEPLSGATMQAAKRLQLSVRLAPVIAFVANATGQFNPTLWGGNLPNQATGQYIPIYWGEEYAELTDSQADAFTAAVYGAQMASEVITIAGQVGACVFVVLAVVLLLLASAGGADGTTGPDTSGNRVVRMNREP